MIPTRQGCSLRRVIIQEAVSAPRAGHPPESQPPKHQSQPTGTCFTDSSTGHEAGEYAAWDGYVKLGGKQFGGSRAKKC